jgi:putative hydrolase of the HAD superfamily
VTALGCVVFDIDDTLFLERDYVASGFEAVGRLVARRLGIPDFAARARRAVAQGAGRRVFDAALAAAGQDPDPLLVQRLVEAYRRHRPAIALLPDARRCLARLAPRVRLAAVSDGPLAAQRAKVRALGLARWLDPIVLTGALGRSRAKPSPEPFRVVERRTGVRGAALVYVADNPVKDFLGPKVLGWRTVRVRRPEGLHRDAPSGPDVDLEISGLDDLEDALRTVAGGVP